MEPSNNINPTVDNSANNSKDRIDSNKPSEEDS